MVIGFERRISPDALREAPSVFLVALINVVLGLLGVLPRAIYAKRIPIVIVPFGEDLTSFAVVGEIPRLCGKSRRCKRSGESSY
jgi:hypothetical protein